jgi:S1-C subfamily serine protease
VIADDLAPLGLTQAKGIVVVSVLNGSLADAMGVLPGDVILQVNGADVGELQHFVQTLHSAAVSTFSVWRKGKTLVLTVPQSM